MLDPELAHLDRWRLLHRLPHALERLRNSAPASKYGADHRERHRCKLVGLFLAHALAKADLARSDEMARLRCCEMDDAIDRRENHRRQLGRVRSQDNPAVLFQKPDAGRIL